MFGSATWTRTRDPMINSHLLYRLSYRGICAYLTDCLEEVKPLPGKSTGYSTSTMALVTTWMLLWFSAATAMRPVSSA
jgi:hypothetical protein